MEDVESVEEKDAAGKMRALAGIAADQARQATCSSLQRINEGLQRFSPHANATTDRFLKVPTLSTKRRVQMIKPQPAQHHGDRQQEILAVWILV
jgi:hypothetical protein